MASAPGHLESMEAELKKFLQDEARHRQEFSVKLLELMNQCIRRRSEEQDSVWSLVKNLGRADETINLLLQKCQDLCLSEDVNSRKEKREERDSGFTSSADIDAVKRRGVCMSNTDRTAVSVEAECGEIVQEEASAVDSAGEPNVPRPGEPTQHTDESSDAESGSPAE